MNIVFASSKGGVGKSTTCLCMAGLLAADQERVLIFDVDRNQTIAKWAAKHSVPNITIKGVSQETLEKEYNTAIASGDYDHVLFDLPGSNAQENISAISVAHLLVIPAGVSTPDMDQAREIIAQLDQLARFRGAEIPYRVLLTRVRPLGHTNNAKQILADPQYAHFKYFNTSIVMRDAYIALMLQGTMPFAAETERGAGPEMRALLTEIDQIISDLAGDMQETG